jgi:hypothetical protein
METPDQYREFAGEEHRKILREMARAWVKLAEEAEQTETQS